VWQTIKLTSQKFFGQLTHFAEPFVVKRFFFTALSQADEHAHRNLKVFTSLL
jgi:hypothetical protein